MPRGLGHTGLLIKMGKKWHYWSWDDQGFGKSHNGTAFKGAVKNKKATKEVNKHKHRMYKGVRR